MGPPSTLQIKRLVNKAHKSRVNRVYYKHNFTPAPLDKLGVMKDKEKSKFDLVELAPNRNEFIRYYGINKMESNFEIIISICCLYPNVQKPRQESPMRLASVQFHYEDRTHGWKYTYEHEELIDYQKLREQNDHEATNTYKIGGLKIDVSIPFVITRIVLNGMIKRRKIESSGMKKASRFSHRKELHYESELVPARMNISTHPTSDKFDFAYSFSPRFMARNLNKSCVHSLEEANYLLQVASQDRIDSLMMFRCDVEILEHGTNKSPANPSRSDNEHQQQSSTNKNQQHHNSTTSFNREILWGTKSRHSMNGSWSSLDRYQLIDFNNYTIGQQNFIDPEHAYLCPTEELLVWTELGNMIQLSRPIGYPNLLFGWGNCGFDYCSYLHDCKCRLPDDPVKTEFDKLSSFFKIPPGTKMIFRFYKRKFLDLEFPELPNSNTTLSSITSSFTRSNKHIPHTQKRDDELLLQMQRQQEESYNRFHVPNNYSQLDHHQSVSSPIPVHLSGIKAWALVRQSKPLELLRRAQCKLLALNIHDTNLTSRLSSEAFLGGKGDSLVKLNGLINHQFNLFDQTDQHHQHQQQQNATTKEPSIVCKRVSVPKGVIVSCFAYQLWLKSHPIIGDSIRRLDNCRKVLSARSYYKNPLNSRHLSLIDWRQALSSECMKTKLILTSSPLPEVVKKHLYAQLISLFEPSALLDLDDGDRQNSNEQLNKAATARSTNKRTVVYRKFFAVRSSAVGEDACETSAAGQMKTFLEVAGFESICRAIVACWASQFELEPVVYKTQNLLQFNLPMSVVVQELIDCNVAGVATTCNPIDGCPSQLEISANRGLGAGVVSGDKTDTIRVRLDKQLKWDSETKSYVGLLSQKPASILAASLEKLTDGIDSHSDCCLSDEMIVNLGNLLIWLRDRYEVKERCLEWAITFRQSGAGGCSFRTEASNSATNRKQQLLTLPDHVKKIKKTASSVTTATSSIARRNSIRLLHELGGTSFEESIYGEPNDYLDTSNITSSDEASTKDNDNAKTTTNNNNNKLTPNAIVITKASSTNDIHRETFETFEIHLLQSRPLTNLFRASRQIIAHELDTGIPSPDDIVTRANMGEVMSGCISPLFSSHFLQTSYYLAVEKPYDKNHTLECLNTTVHNLCSQIITLSLTNSDSCNRMSGVTEELEKCVEIMVGYEKNDDYNVELIKSFRRVRYHPLFREKRGLLKLLCFDLGFVDCLNGYIKWTLKDMDFLHKLTSIDELIIMHIKEDFRKTHAHDIAHYIHQTSSIHPQTHGKIHHQHQHEPPIRPNGQKDHRKTGEFGDVEEEEEEPPEEVVNLKLRPKSINIGKLGFKLNPAANLELFPGPQDELSIKLRRDILHLFKKLTHETVLIERSWLNHVRSTILSMSFNTVCLFLLRRQDYYKSIAEEMERKNVILNDFSVLIRDYNKEKTISGQMSRQLDKIINHLAKEGKILDYQQMSTGQLYESLNDFTNRESSAKKFRRFIKNYGHRTFKEFDYATPTWNDDPTQVIKSLALRLRLHSKRTVPKLVTPTQTFELINDADLMTSKTLTRNTNLYGASIRRQPNANEDHDREQRFEQILNRVTSQHAILINYAVPRAQKAAARREQTKSSLIKTIDVFRKGFRALGAMLCLEGRLSDSQLIFYMALDEVAEIVNASDERRVDLARIVFKARRRQQVFLSIEGSSLPIPTANILREFKMIDDIIDGKQVRNNQYEPSPEALELPIGECQSNSFEQKMQSTSSIFVHGMTSCNGLVTGRACVIDNIDQLDAIEPNDILITYSIDISWTVYFFTIAGIVTEIGGIVSHGAVVAREYGIPTLCKAIGACRKFKTGQIVTLDAIRGVCYLVSDPTLTKRGLTRSKSGEVDNK